jgi:hypothetical protein
MPIMLILIAIFLAAGAGAATFAAMHTRKLWREQKNFERGLKMVPLLIHLPPSSSDTEVGSRDARDVIDETISKAETLYDIIASTVKKGRKSKFYGQRHMAFEIIARKGFVQFYAAVPVVLIEVVQQAIVSAYPSARMEEVAEHNIFSAVGRTSGTVGGELTLKEDTAYPIATFQELKRDTMQSLLNALSTLDKEDGAGVQILMRPAQSQWRKDSIALAQKKRKNEEHKGKGKMVSSWFGQVLYAPFKPPEESKHEQKKDEKPLSGIDQALIEAIEEKTKHAGYEVCIRLIASSNTLQRSQSALNSLAATFSLFDSPGKNGFKFVPAKDIDSFITAYILRFFPPENNKMILNAIELATIFHFPDQNSIPTTQLQRQASKQADGPRNMPDDGLLLGYNVFRGVKKKINLSLDDRRRHLYLVGQTGTGKSTFLENLALQDMLNGDGFAFIDPHGDVAEKLLALVPKERTEDVVYFCPADMDYPLGLNLFEYDDPDQQDFLIQEAINMLYKLYDPQHQGIIGPRYEHWFRMASRTIMADPAGATFIDIPKVFTDNQYAKEKLKFVKDKVVLDFWNKEMAQTSDYHKSEVLGWFVSKFGAFMANEMMRNIIGQTKSSFNIREIMDNKKILLVNLSKGRTGELNSKLLGMIFVMKFQAAAMSRASIPESERQDFCLYVDEFQNFSTDSFASILSEARKYRLNLIVANQFTTQLTDEIRDAVFGNIGTIVSFRVGTADAEMLAKQFTPIFDMDDLQRVPNGNMIMRMLIGGVPTQPFSMAGLPPLGNINKELGDALKQLSAAKFGRPRAIVEKEIMDRLHTDDLEPIDVQKPVAGRMAAAPQAPNKPKPAASFLDDWLQKKETNSFKAPSSPFNKEDAQAPQTMPPAAPVSQQPLQPQAYAAPPQLAPVQSTAVPLQPASPIAQQPLPVQQPHVVDPMFSHADAQHIAHPSPQTHSQPAVQLTAASPTSANEGVIHQSGSALSTDDETVVHIR